MIRFPSILPMPVVYWNIMFYRELSCSVYSITIQSFLDKIYTEINLIIAWIVNHYYNSDLCLTDFTD